MEPNELGNDLPIKISVLGAPEFECTCRLSPTKKAKMPNTSNLWKHILLLKSHPEFFFPSTTSLVACSHGAIQDECLVCWMVGWLVSLEGRACPQALHMILLFTLTYFSFHSSLTKRKEKM